MSALNLGLKVLFASQEVESGIHYDPALVQSMFLHNVFPLASRMTASQWISMTTDEQLLEKLNSSCPDEAERQNKRKLDLQQSAVIHAVQSEETTAEKKCPVNQNTSNVSLTVITKLKDIRDQK